MDAIIIIITLVLTALFFAGYWVALFVDYLIEIIDQISARRAYYKVGRAVFEYEHFACGADKDRALIYSFRIMGHTKPFWR